MNIYDSISDIITISDLTKNIWSYENNYHIFEDTLAWYILSFQPFRDE